MVIVAKLNEPISLIFGVKQKRDMNFNRFIIKNELKPIDAIVLRKRFLGMVDHYVIFMGFRRGIPVFIANYGSGVKEIPSSDMNKFIRRLDPERIDYFRGNDLERELAIRRAMSRIGERAYNYISNNCEHFKNWVHFGHNYSTQVNSAGNNALIIGAATTIVGVATKNKSLTYIGLGSLLVGAIVKDFADD